jgi:hypothetical protein
VRPSDPAASHQGKLRGQGHYLGHPGGRRDPYAFESQPSTINIDDHLPLKLCVRSADWKLNYKMENINSKRLFNNALRLSGIAQFETNDFEEPVAPLSEVGLPAATEWERLHWLVENQRPQIRRRIRCRRGRGTVEGHGSDLQAGRGKRLGSLGEDAMLALE